jgi:hypothetical protein
MEVHAGKYKLLILCYGLKYAAVTMAVSVRLSVAKKKLVTANKF